MTDTAANEDVRNDKLERILQLAQAARATENSLKWKTSTDDAIEEHGDACTRLWEELYRQLDERGAMGNAVVKWKPAPDVREELRKSVVRALKADLPGQIAALVEDIIDSA